MEVEDQGVKNPAADHRRELYSRVRARSGDTFPQECHMMNQNMKELTGKDKLDKTIKLIMTRGIHVFFL